MKNRRDFLKQTSFLCGGVLLAGTALTTESCKVKTATSAPTITPNAVVDGKVNIPVDDFKELNSRIIEVSSAGPMVTKITLLVNKNPDGTYTAFEYICPHERGPLVKEGDKLVCPWHNSQFTLNGDLIQGPAKTGLTKYPVTVEKGNVVVKVS